MVSLMMVSQWLYRNETRLATLRLVCVRGSNYPWWGRPWDSTLDAAPLPLGVPATDEGTWRDAGLGRPAMLSQRLHCLTLPFQRSPARGASTATRSKRAHLWLKERMQQIAIRLRSQGSRILRASVIPSVNHLASGPIKATNPTADLQRNGQAVCGFSKAKA